VEKLIVSTLDANSIIWQAEIAAGAGKIDEGLAGRVRRIVNAINTYGTMTEDQARAATNQLRKILYHRLRMAGDRARLPGIAAQEIKRPIFVVGMPRSGTSMLHSLLATHPGTDAPVWWMSVDPSPPPGEVPVSPQRLGYAALELDLFMLRAQPLFPLHPYWDARDQAIVENEELFTLDFQNAYAMKCYDVPTLSVDLNAPEKPVEAYKFLREYLQHFQWNRSVTHWVTKGISHQYSLAALFEVFPDAIVLWPHRNPTDILPSTYAIMSVVFGTINNWNTDPRKLAAADVENMRESFKFLMNDPAVHDPRVHHIDFRKLAKDPVATIRGIYDQEGLSFSSEFAAGIEGWLANPANASNRWGRYQYSYEQYGISVAEIDKGFAEYRRHFGIE